MNDMSADACLRRRLTMRAHAAVKQHRGSPGFGNLRVLTSKERKKLSVTSHNCDLSDVDEGFVTVTFCWSSQNDIQQLYDIVVNGKLLNGKWLFYRATATPLRGGSHQTKWETRLVDDETYARIADSVLLACV